MGRNPLPSEIKRLKGTLRPCRENKLEPQPNTPIGDPPEYMSDRAKEIWYNTVGYMPPGVITMCDTAILETYCNNCALREELQKKVNDGAVTYGTKVAAEFRALKDVQMAIMQAGSQLGLTPAARQKVAQGYGDPTNNDDSTLDLFAQYEAMEVVHGHA